VRPVHAPVGGLILPESIQHTDPPQWVHFAENSRNFHTASLVGFWPDEFTRAFPFILSARRIEHFFGMAWHGMLPLVALSNELDWSMGGYAGKYYDTEPAGFINGRGNFLDHHLVALTASKTIWRSQSLPLSVELDAMIGLQSGVASFGEVAFAPALRWGDSPGTIFCKLICAWLLWVSLTPAG
jgi:hypothetical protein